MYALRRGDLDRVLSFLGDASDVEGPEPFTTELLDRVLEVVPCEFAAYADLDLAAGVVCAEILCSAENESTPPQEAGPLDEGWRREIERSPVRAHRRRIGKPSGVGIWADVPDGVAEARSNLADWGVVDHACVSLSDSSVNLVWLALHSTRMPFSERDRAVLELLEPHIAARVRAARARRRLAELVASDERDAAVVVVSPEGEIEAASDEGRRLLETYFGVKGDRLYDELPWRSRGRHLSGTRDGRRLVVDAVGRDGTLVLSVEPDVPLTARERDVLRCLAAGRSTAETARLLWVTPATVSKHLEHIYRKLGVTNRTAALAAIPTRWWPAAST